MSEKKRLSAIDGFIKKANKWQEEMAMLRELFLDAELVETVKWRHPCYMYENKNTAIIQDFKEYCAIMFIKGVLLDDPHQLLYAVGESASQRQLRFTDVKEIEEKKDIIRLYIQMAIELEISGKKVKSTEVNSLELPKELEDKFAIDPNYRNVFYALTPGRQKAYIFYFAKAKKSETRVLRIEKALPDILNGLGPNGK